jgi:hypothetical protein
MVLYFDIENYLEVQNFEIGRTLKYRILTVKIILKY